MSLFVAVNILVFQPWDWDDHKLLVYWFLMVALVVGGRADAPVAARRHDWVTRHARRGRHGRDDDVVRRARGRQHAARAKPYRMLQRDQMTLAAEIRQRTEPDALFISGMQNHDPDRRCSPAGGSTSGTPNWLWTEGIPYEARTDEAKRHLPRRIRDRGADGRASASTTS